MLTGVEVIDLQKRIDDRGFFVEILRRDWKDFLRGDEILQVNLSSILPGVIKAWHRHSLGQVDYVIALSGVIRVCVYDGDIHSDSYSMLDEFTMSPERLQVLRIPGHYWHGIKALGNAQATVLYLHNKLYSYENPDEERRPWNDSSIINPRTSKAYDWNLANLG